MRVRVRREFTIIGNKFEEFGCISKRPLKKIAVVSVVENPLVGRYEDDLSGMINASVEIGRDMAKRAMEAMGTDEVQSYGKAGIVGLGGEQEHANALLTTAFADPIREAIGQARAWISSMTKVAAPGTSIDVPMNHKDDVYVRSHYDGMTVTLADTPMPNEIALIFWLANRGRLNARVGGLTHEDVLTRG